MSCAAGPILNIKVKSICFNVSVGAENVNTVALMACE